VLKWKTHNNVCIPCIGFGTWKLKNTVAAEVVRHAIQLGYHLIDTASAYGNEEYVGTALDGTGIKRSDLFITGKLWNSEREYSKAINAFYKTLKNLKLSYLDSYLMHWPASPAIHDNWRDINAEAWSALEKLYTDGSVRTIGVCNFKKHQLEELLKSASVMPMVNQIEYHPGQTQTETADFCRKNNIIIEAWSPLGSGKLLKIQELERIAKKYGKSVAQLCIKWCLQNEVIPLPRTKTYERIVENIDIFGFTIDDMDMSNLNKMQNIGDSGLDPEKITLFG